MAKQYGNTWWGKKWLDSLSYIDHSNRLSRGKSYANTGKVLDINIEGQEIMAKVQGSAPRPYRQSINLSPFTKKDMKLIVEAILENPYFLSRLLNRELPVELFDVIKNTGVDIFPTRWKDLNGVCACPDYSVPCKHLAAVIYMIANEIDKNPFLLFELRGLDLLEALQETGDGKNQSNQIPIKTPDDFFVNVIKPEKNAFEFRRSLVEQLDFSALPYSKDRILQLLAVKPLFCMSHDFKNILDDNYKRIAKSVEKNALQPSRNQDYSIHIETDNFTVFLDADLDYWQTEVRIGDETKVWDKRKELENLDAALSRLPLSQLSNYCPQVQALYWIRQAAVHLLVQNAIIPQLVNISENQYKVRWIPALVIAEVRDLIGVLAALCPPKTILYSISKTAVNAQEQVISAMALFLGHWVELSAVNKHETEAESIFFEQNTFSTKNFLLRETPQAIQKWLQKFYLQEKDFAPLLKIDEDEKSNDFLLSCWIEDKHNSIEPLLAFKDIFIKNKKYAAIQSEVLRDFALLAEYLPAIAEIMQSKGEQMLRFTPSKFATVFMEVLPIIRVLGVKVLLPKALDRVLRPRPTVRISKKGSVGANSSFINLSHLLAFDWQIAIGDEMISADEFKKLMRYTRGLVKIRDSYVFLDEKDFQEVLKKLENPPKLSENELLHSALKEEYDGAKIELSPEVNELMKQFTQTPEIELPKGIVATLRPYQQKGYEWLYKNARLGFGSLLADDMGLGKTLQTIVFLQKLKEEGAFKKQQALAVLPTTLLSNWQREIKKFAPELKASIYHGSKRQMDDKADIILSSYGVVRSDEKILIKKHWKVLLIDEAQNIKNAATAQTKAVKKLKADILLALSGTPVENRLSEYWSIFDFVNKGYLGGLKYFTDTFSRPIEIDRNQHSLAAFLKITAPFILRRLKTDKSIIDDLPDKVEQDQPCTLTPEQSSLYQLSLEQAMSSIEKENDNFSRQGLVLQMINALKQICNHPAQFLKRGAADPALSGKAQVLLELLERILEADEKVLIFTQYKEMGDLLVEMLKKHFNFNPLWLHGGSSRKQRDDMVEQFQNKAYPKIMILSLKAGGTGLNLTEANHVIHYDLWWNPAVEAQATDRAFRIGQKKNVQVYRFITQNTFEEKINEMIRAKKNLADLTVSAGENWVGNLSNEELREMFSLTEEQV